MAAKRTKAGGRLSTRGAPVLRANVAQLRAVAHPLRLRILELCAEVPRTTKQVADLLGQPTTRMYHHVNALERAGLLEVRETRANRGTVEKLFGAEARYAGSTTGDAGDTSVAGLAVTVLEQSRHEVTSAMRGMRMDRCRPLVVRAIVTGPEARHERVREHLTKLVNQLKEEAGRTALRSSTNPERLTLTSGHETPWAVTITFAPVKSATAAIATHAAGGHPAKTRRRRSAD